MKENHEGQGYKKACCSFQGAENYVLKQSAHYLAASKSLAACRDLPRAASFQHFQLLNLEIKCMHAYWVRVCLLGLGSRKSHIQFSRIRQQNKTATKIQCCFMNNRVNEADRFVSGLIDFLIQLY